MTLLRVRWPFRSHRSGAREKGRRFVP